MTSFGKVEIPQGEDGDRESVQKMTLEEVVRGLPGDVRLPPPGRGVELEEGILQGVVKFHDSSLTQGEG